VLDAEHSGGEEQARTDEKGRREQRRKCKDEITHLQLFGAAGFAAVVRCV